MGVEDCWSGKEYVRTVDQTEEAFLFRACTREELRLSKAQFLDQEVQQDVNCHRLITKSSTDSSFNQLDY